ncbi:hypothetical protein [Pseudochrobactrum sp. HB0163]
MAAFSTLCGQDLLALSTGYIADIAAHAGEAVLIKSQAVLAGGYDFMS